MASTTTRTPITALSRKMDDPLGLGGVRMHKRVLAKMVLAGLSATPLAVSAQEKTTDDARPASSNVRGAAYPRVHGDLRVTFRVSAPKAQKVQIQPGGGDNGL